MNVSVWICLLLFVYHAFSTKHTTTTLAFLGGTSRIFSSKLTSSSKWMSQKFEEPALLIGKTIRNPLVPFLPLLIFFFSTSKCVASPLNPHAISVNGPFFQGWLVRVVDHVKQLSFMLIVGSFSCLKSKVYNEHYIFCGINTPSETIYSHALPPPSTVHISGSSPSYLSVLSNSHSPLNISWTAEEYGYFKFTGSHCRAHFTLKDVAIDFDITGRIPWSDRNHLSGPEGWLGYTSLLPCHYFISTVGSPATYSVTLSKKNRVRGTGHAHIEGNHGTFFPSAWVWSQAIAPNNTASFSLVGGRFTIGPISPMNWVLYLRSPQRRARIFRTTEGARLKYKVEAATGAIQVEAVSVTGREMVRLHVESHVAIQAFSPPLYTPGPQGFSNTPGCRETYTAVATATCYERDVSGKYVIVENLRFPLSVLEFGGTFCL